MKKIISMLIVAFVCKISMAQDVSGLPPRDINKNEININPLNIIAFGALDFGYERVISNNTSVGADIFYRVADSRDDTDDIIDTDGVFDKEIAFTTRVKYFFGDRIARGFYVEAFGMISSGDNNKHEDIFDVSGNHISSEDVYKEYTDFALGFGVGGKFVAKNGFFLDIGFGIGRNLFNNDSPEIIIRPNLYIGYRF